MDKSIDVLAMDYLNDLMLEFRKSIDFFDG